MTDPIREALVRAQDVLRRYMRHEHDATVRTSANQVLHEIKAALANLPAKTERAAVVEDK